MRVVEVTREIEWPPHWGKASGVGGDRSSHPRIPHVSGLVADILADAGMGMKGEGWPQESLTMAAEMGFTWEVLIEKAFGERFGEVIERPGEVYLDGIVGSPDGWHEKSETLHEYKLKWSSCDNFELAQETKWLMQVKSYCKMLGCVRTRFWVFFIVGNWKFGKDKKFPHPRVYDVVFDKAEVDSHWELMKRYRAKRLEKGSGKSERS